MSEEAKKPFISKKNLAFFAMVVGMFMAILDIQIVASSLPVIAAGLSATQEELSWVQTAYIIAEVVIIPLTGFTAKLLSTRISYLIATAGFTIMSVLCAFSSTIESMILARALQGFFGGAMIPTVFAIVYIIFEPKERPVIMVMMGLVVTLAPTLGPTLGGYITDILSWHFMFLINVIPGILVCITIYLYADFDKPDYSLIKNFDFLGVTLLITSLGCFQYILEEGARKDWFENNTILALSLYVFLGLSVLIYHELTTKKPILYLYAFKDTNFRYGCILSGVLGVGLYGSVFLLPIFLGRAAGLNTIQIGVIMAVMGVSQFLSAPIAGKMMEKNFDRRIMMGFGIGLFGIGCYVNSFMTHETRFDELILPQFIRGFSLMFCFVPINDLTLGTLGKDKVQDASGLYNLMRNLGGAFGLAIINSNITNSIVINRDILSSNISSTSQMADNSLGFFEYMIGSHLRDPQIGSIEILNNFILRDSFIIAINNMFSYLAVIFFLSMILIFFTKNTKQVEANVH
jgi:DHA2 family multidrug resistance protein